MILPIQFKLKENPYYLRYLRANSIWYKLLNRDPSNFRQFEEAVKKEYRLTRTDRLENIFNTIEMMEKILSSFK